MNHAPRRARTPIAVGAVRRSFAPWTDPAAEPLIRFEGVAKRFGDVPAVENLSLDIYEREFFCLLGPSGCGKTTLMRMLGGFETPTAGRVTLGGQDLAGIPPHRRPVNMMFQSYALFPHMTVAGNVGYGLRQGGTGRKAAATRVDEMLRLVQLEGLGKRYPEQLSGGQRQRVALARALARQPRVLLLDEPLAALDKKLREETQFQLMDLQVELGTTFLMVTHDQEEAMTLADRIGVMDGGRLVQVATPGEIYEQPRTRFVAEFVGDVNILEGEVLGSEGGVWRIATSLSPAPLAVADPDQSFAAGQRVAVAVRPEKMVLRREPPGEETPNALAGDVWDIGYLGDWTIYRVRIGEGAIWRVSRANAARFVERPIGWDETVHLTFDPAAAVILTS